MNIYCEFCAERIRIKIDGEENSFQVNAGFYTHRMMVHTGISSRIRNYVRYHQTALNFFENLMHKLTKNKVFILVNPDVQILVTLRQTYEFAGRYLDGGTIYVIPKPPTFDSTLLEHIEKISSSESIKENQNRDTAISQLRLSRTPNPVV